MPHRGNHHAAGSRLVSEAGLMKGREISAQRAGRAGKALSSSGASESQPKELPSVRKVLATECIRRMRGGSQPFLMGCNDGCTYIVKFRNNPQHVRILANEMLTSHLAALIGLPVPDRALVE